MTPLFTASTDLINAPPLDEHQVLVFLVQLSLLVGMARLLGAGMKMIGQPAVVGELLAGVILGPSLFAQVTPASYAWVFEAEPVVNSAVFGLAWLGVIMLLVVIGFETDLAIIARFGRAAVFVSAGSLLIPFAVGVGLASYAPANFLGENGTASVFAGFFALALSVSALPVVAKILQDLGFLRRNFGQITLAAGMTMDSLGWLILAALAGVAREGALDLASLGRLVGGLVIFLLLSVSIGRWVIDRLYKRAMAMGSSTTAALTITLLAAFTGSAVTQWLGLEAILGAFIVGILLSTTRHQLPSVRETLETFTTSFFAPIFFAFSGLRVDLSALSDPTAIAWTVGVVVTAISAKVFGTYFGARLGGLSNREGWAIGSGLSALGAMGIVVALVGLNTGVLSDLAYTILVVTAIVTSLVAPALLRVVVRGFSASESERTRLQKESLRESSVLLHSSRILLPTRGGQNSIYAAKLVEAVFESAEMTVMAVDVPEGFMSKWMARLSHSVRGSSQGIQDVRDAVTIPTRLARKRARDPAKAIAVEAQLGYDLVVLGASEAESDGEAGIFSTVVDRVLSRIAIPSIVVRFPASPAVDLELPKRILIPINASQATRAAEEFAYSIASTAEGKVTAFHIVNQPEGQGMMLESHRIDDARRMGIELLADAADLGSKLGLRVATILGGDQNPELTIVEKANSGDFDLLVLGASQRALGNRSFLGHRVTYIVENSEIPVAIVGLPSAVIRGH